MQRPPPSLEFSVLLPNHRKVSEAELSPWASGLMSTLTQATFSWLCGEGRKEGESLRRLSFKVEMHHFHNTAAIGDNKRTFVQDFFSFWCF